MGVSNYDKESTQRRLDALYALTTPEGVKKLLEEWDKLLIMPYDRGDYGIIDLIIDFKIAYSEAKTSPKQRQALELCLVQGYTQEEVAGIVGVGQDAISKRIDRGAEAIAKVFTNWTNKGDY